MWYESPVRRQLVCMPWAGSPSDEGMYPHIRFVDTSVSSEHADNVATRSTRKRTRSEAMHHCPNATQRDLIPKTRNVDIKARTYIRTRGHVIRGRIHPDALHHFRVFCVSILIFSQKRTAKKNCVKAPRNLPTPPAPLLASAAEVWQKSLLFSGSHVLFLSMSTSEQNAEVLVPGKERDSSFILPASIFLVSLREGEKENPIYAEKRIAVVVPSIRSRRQLLLIGFVRLARKTKHFPRHQPCSRSRALD